MHEWTRSALVQIKVCRLVVAKPLPEPMLTYCQLETNFSDIWIEIIQENVVENVAYEMTAILSGGRWVKRN